MKSAIRNVLTFAVGAALVLSSGASMADSQYGYNAAGTGPVTAQAHLTVTVNVPLLILLRVGSATGTGDTVNLNAAFASGVPGGPATLTGGSNQAATWDGNAPSLTVTSNPTSVTASGWTNSTGGGNLKCTVSTPFGATSGLTSASVSVTSSPASGAGSLAHPGTDTSCGGTTTFARNAIASSTWTFSMSAANLAAANPGTNSESLTYTATTL
jgi:hypothetical protein